MKLDSIAQLLLETGLVADEGGFGVPRLFLYSAPAAEHMHQDSYALLVTDLAGMSVNEQLPNYHKGKFSLITASEDVDAGYDLALKLSKSLTVYGLELDDMYIYRCVPRHLPIQFRRNEQNQFEHSVTFDINIRLK